MTWTKEKRREYDRVRYRRARGLPLDGPYRKSWQDPRICGYCGSEFVPTIPAQRRKRYCGPECVAQACSERQQIRHPDDSSSRRTQRERYAPGLSKGQRTALLRKWQRQNRVCVWCTTAVATTVDHVLPLVRGGTNYEGNLVPACKPCNSRRCAATPMEYRLGKRPARMTTQLQRAERVERQARIKPVPEPSYCKVCNAQCPGKRRKYCSEQCSYEVLKTYVRNRYRAEHGIPLDSPNYSSLRF